MEAIQTLGRGPQETVGSWEEGEEACRRLRVVKSDIWGEACKGLWVGAGTGLEGHCMVGSAGSSGPGAGGGTRLGQEVWPGLEGRGQP